MQIYIEPLSLLVQERGTIDHLHVKFNEVDPEDIRGKYSHKIYGYLLPPHPGIYIALKDAYMHGCMV